MMLRYGMNGEQPHSGADTARCLEISPTPSAGRARALRNLASDSALTTFRDAA